MKTVSANLTANLLTCHPREAGANLLNSFQYPDLSLHMSRPDSNPIGIPLLFESGQSA